MHGTPRLHFATCTEEYDYIPIDLFNSVLDNLLQNAQEKRLQEPKIFIAVHLVWQNGIGLEVHDTGSAIPDEVATRLLRHTINSENGMGIGLYQANKQAQQVGYIMKITQNKPGLVVLGLYPQAT